jgi:hypothetical protein
MFYTSKNLKLIGKKRTIYRIEQTDKRINSWIKSEKYTFRLIINLSVH